MNNPETRRIRPEQPTVEEVEKICTSRSEDWEEWIASRPLAVRVAIAECPWWHVYRLKATGQKVVIESYSESDNGVSLKVDVLMDPRPSTKMRDAGIEPPFMVFGVSPSELERWVYEKAEEV